MLLVNQTTRMSFSSLCQYDKLVVQPIARLHYSKGLPGVQIFF